MKFFNIDMHASVIMDIADIFKKLGHHVDDWSLSGHAHIMGKEKKNIVFNDGSKLICAGVCTQETCDKFYDAFKEKLDKYDGFIACYPVEFAMLYEKWNKPIIIVNCIRYEHPNIKYKNIWNRLDIFLKKWNKKGLLWYVCNNKGDQWYTEYFTGIKGIHIPNLCEYTNEKYTGIKNEFIIHIRSHVEQIPNNCKTLSSYTWKNLYSYKGIIHNPYHNGSMSIFEHYTANIPMFMPSKKFIKQLFYEGKTLNDLTFCKIYNMDEPDDENNPLSLKNEKILEKWINTCDFYDENNMPYIQLFDSWEHMNKLLKTVNYKEISENMANFNIKRREQIFLSWSNILNKINECNK